MAENEQKLTEAGLSERQQKRHKEIEDYWHQIFKPRWLHLDQIFNPSWLNDDIPMDMVKEAIDYKLEKIKADLDTLRTQPSWSKAAEVSKWAKAVEVYKKTLNITEALGVYAGKN